MLRIRKSDDAVTVEDMEGILLTSLESSKIPNTTRVEHSPDRSIAADVLLRQEPAEDEDEEEDEEDDKKEDDDDENEDDGYSE
jgi:hypothetical protein